MKSLRLFNLYYALLAIFEIISEIYRFIPGIYLAKPLLMISLGTYGYLTFKKKSTPKCSLYLIAAFFACLGDVFLMLKEYNFFLPGLGAFLIMQWFYITIFYKDVSIKISSKKAILPLTPFMAFAILLIYILWPSISHDKVLITAIIIYALSISIMGWMSYLRKESVNLFSFYYVAIGAILFILSDSMIAIGKFISPIPNSALLIMGTYAAAQYLILMGLIEDLDR